MVKERDDVGSMFMEIQRHWRSILDKRLRPLGLSQAKWRALLHLSKSKNGLTQTDLAAHIGIETPTLVRLLDRLQKDGWVKRCESPSDRRCKVVRLTAKAAKVIRHISKTAQDLRDELFSGVSRKDLVAVVRVLSKIKARAESVHNLEVAGKA